MSVVPDTGLGRRVDADRVALESLIDARGRIVMTFEPGLRHEALVAGSMLADALGEGVRLDAEAGPEPLLRLHVGDSAPERPGRMLVLRWPVLTVDTAARFERRPGSACSPARVAALGWSVDAPGEAVLESDRGPMLSRAGDTWYLNADLPGVFGREVLRHAEARADMGALLASQFRMRVALTRMGLLRDGEGKALSLITIDAEDQQRYFINRLGVCSNIRGEPSGDLQFATSCRTAMDRCEELGLKAVFMVTGDELDPSFRDAFGDALIGLDENRRVLDAIGARGHDFACHGFDHEWWLTKGAVPIDPVILRQKLAYYARTSGDLRTLPGLAMFLWRHAGLLWQARSAKQNRETANEPFTFADVANDIRHWAEVAGFCGRELFIPYPGYVRSAATVDYLDEAFDAVVDSSDLYGLDVNLPAYPYRLLAMRGGRLKRTRVTEIACVSIDERLRTRNSARAQATLDRLDGLVRFPGSVLRRIDETKLPDCAGFSSACKARKGAHSPAM
jgi:hypothetical protein